MNRRDKAENLPLKYFRYLFSMLVILCITAPFGELSAQVTKGIVRGKILDTNGVPLIGTTVSVVQTTIGAATDLEGNYILRNVPNGSTLSFRFVGYVTEDKKATFGAIDDITINAVLIEDAASLDAVSVVAFGTQKKESVIGSIATVSAKDLKAPTSNLTTALAGKIAGVIAYQRSGEPGADNASFFIRGVTSFNDNTNPLILIDNIELTATDLARLQPDEIESFSVMKDATATALYGARGANGVILVKTKSGQKGKAKLTIRLENSLSAPTREVDLADPISYMKLNNEAILTRNPSALREYSDDKIRNTVLGSNSVVYPATNWKDMLLKDLANSQRVNISISGGGDKMLYYVASSFSNDNGIIKNESSNNFKNNISQKVYTLRSNVNIDITPTTELITRLSGTFTDYSGPITGGATLYEMIMKSNPVKFPAVYPKDEKTSFLPYPIFGNYNDGSDSYYLNPYAEAVSGYKESGRAHISAQFEVKQDLKFITKGLNARVLINVLRNSNYSISRSYKPAYYFLDSYDPMDMSYDILPKDPEGTNFGILGYGLSDKRVSANTYFEGAVDYNREFGKHGVSGLLVYQMRNQIQPDEVDVLLSLPKRNLGLSGRATYSYDRRFFAEFNFGYNGSERFSKQNRWGFFPSAGGAWIISNEKFFAPLKSKVNNLKLRVSYGVVGNDNLTGNDLDRFFFMSNINMNSNKNFVFGEGQTDRYSKTGIDILRYANPEISWEKAYKTNIALEIGLFNSLNIIAEYYRERREGIYQKRVNIPETMGLMSDVYANIGEAKGHGVDLSMDYNKYFNNDTWLQLRGNLTYASSEFSKYEERNYKEPWRSRLGYSINQQWGYIAEGLFVDDAEVANSPSLSGAMAGDIKYRDVNKDGLIDDADKVPIGFPTVPEIVYGFGASFGYKGFDISCFFQGSARESLFINYDNNAPFIESNQWNKKGNTQLTRFIADSHWSEDNQDIYATWPRLTTTSSPNNSPVSTWWMRNASFIRLKQAEIGYSLPKALLEKISISSLRIYLSGTNLLCFSGFKLWDPELGSNSMSYPLQRVFNIGVNLTF